MDLCLTGQLAAIVTPPRKAAHRYQTGAFL
jgi:hypothetical protein